MSEPAWVQAARESIEEAARENQKRQAEKGRALVAVAERRRDSYGKFMRSKVAKRYTREGREVFSISVPLALAEAIRVESEDAAISISRMVVELAALGLPIWREYRESFLYRSDENEYIPPRVRAVLQNAVNPVLPQSRKAWNTWHETVESNLRASIKPKKQKATDATTAVLQGLGGSRGTK